MAANVFGKISIADEELFIASVYAPNDQQLQLYFIQALSQTIVSVTNTSKVIITGDWNTTLHSIYKRGWAPWKETIEKLVIETQLSASWKNWVLLMISVSCTQTKGLIPMNQKCSN